MNEIRLRESGEVVSEQQFRAMHNVAFPEVLTADILNTCDADPVLASPQPATTSSQTSSRNGVVQDVLGNWVWAWQVSDIPAEIIAANLASAKTVKNLAINQWRLEANKTTFPYLGKTIACDSLSRSDIDGVAGCVSLTGVFPAGFPGAWKTVSNKYITLSTVQDFKDMYSAMTAEGTVNFNKSQVLKQALEAATTIEDVQAITWAA